MLGVSPLRPTEPELSDATCREYYRRLAAGVAVVTACGPSGWSGTTVSTLTSVSMDPPIILTCVKGGSRTLTAIEHAGCFAAHLLTEAQSDLAERFSRPPSDSTRFVELGYEIGLHRGAPVIADALAVAWCDVHAITEVGDHSVVYGRVTAVNVNGGRPLLWHNRGFHFLPAPMRTTA